MEVRVIKNPITRAQLKEIALERYGDLVKAVVDIEQGIMAVGGELHADEQVLLINQEGSKNEYVWGINLYPEKSGDEFVEFDSMVNLKPTFGNRSRGVEDATTQGKIREVVSRLIVG